MKLITRLLWGEPSMPPDVSEKTTIEKVLGSMRSKMQRSEATMGDPMATFDQMEPEMEQLQDQIRGLRHFSPVMGDLADTLASCLTLASRMADQLKSLKKEKEGAPVSPPVSALGDSGDTVPGRSGKQPTK